MKKLLQIIALGCVCFSSCDAPRKTQEVKLPSEEKHNFSQWDDPGGYDEPKAGFLPAVTPEVIDYINRNRWTQGQYQMSVEMAFGHSCDLNGDGIDELFVITGEQDPNNFTYYVVLRLDRDRPEIIGALRRNFAFNKRPGEWHEIVEDSGGAGFLWRRTGLRFDGEVYRRIWCYEKTDEQSEPKPVEIQG